MTNTPHKHAALIKAWADGAVIEMACYGNMSGMLLGWKEQNPPYWHEGGEYRIKPEPKLDIIMFGRISNTIPAFDSLLKKTEWRFFKQAGDNAKAIFDGETNTIKSVEIIK